MLEFGLIGNMRWAVRTGANRNVILLHTVGELILSADDDSICNTGQLSNTIETPGLILGGGLESSHSFDLFRSCIGLAVYRSHRGGRFSRTRTPAWEGISASSSMSIVMPLYILTAPVPSYSRSAPGKGHVYITWNGVVGDSGLNPRAAILHREVVLRQQRASPGPDYEELLLHRETVRQFLSNTVCHYGAPMTTATGLDNRDMLPPFFPGFRNQDGVFVDSVRYCIQDSYFGHLPFVLVHNPPELRKNMPGWTTQNRISDIVLECIRCGPEPIGKHSVQERLISLGKHFSEIGALPANDFRKWLQVLLFKRASLLIQRQENLLARL